MDDERLVTFHFREHVCDQAGFAVFDIAKNYSPGLIDHGVKIRLRLRLRQVEGRRMKTKKPALAGFFVIYWDAVLSLV